MVDSVGSSTASNATTSTTSSKSPLTVSGLVSGIDSATIIDALIKADSATTNILKKQQSLTQARLDAVRSFNTKILSAQLGLNDLKKSTSFQNRQATSGDATALAVASTTSSAVAGTYLLDVVKVAKAHQLATTGANSAASPIGTGTVQVTIGTGPVTTLDFSAGGSLNDVAAAINGANLGAIASVVSDGTASPYRLVLQSTQTGLANSLVVTGTGDFAAKFSNMQELTTPNDAQVRVGGTAGFIVTQASNTFANIVPGVSLEAKAEKNGVAITVTNDASAAKGKITTFIDDLNTAITYFNQNSQYDSTTKQAGILLSESGLRSQLSAIQRTLISAVPGLPSTMNNAGALGITIDAKTGTFTINDAKLSEALANNADGVMRVFTNTGTSSNSAVQFSFLTSQTKVDNPFTVDITQAAAQATVATTGDLDATTTIDSSNDQLNLSINGKSYNLTLAHGAAYTRSDLAQLVQTTINAAVPKQGPQVAVSTAANRLDLRTALYGSNQSIQVLASSTAATALKLSTLQTTGVDVAGTINGVAATGNGQLLKGAASTAADGLSLLVTATQAIAGVTVTARKGVSQQAGEVFNRLTDSRSGAIATKDAALTDSISDMDAQIAKKNTILESRKAYYQMQFIAMEKTIAKLQGQSSYITQLSNALSKSSSSS